MNETIIFKYVLVNREADITTPLGRKMYDVSIQVPKDLSSSGFAHIICSEEYIDTNDKTGAMELHFPEDRKRKVNVKASDGTYINIEMMLSELKSYAEKNFKEYQIRRNEEFINDKKKYAYYNGDSICSGEILINTISNTRTESGEKKIVRYITDIKVPKNISDNECLKVQISPAAFIKPGKKVHFKASKFIEFKNDYPYTIGFKMDHERTVKVFKDSEWIEKRMLVSEIRDLNASAS